MNQKIKKAIRELRNKFILNKNVFKRIYKIIKESNKSDFPIYVLDLVKLKKNYKIFKSYFKNYPIHFAMKSNSNIEVLKTLFHEGSNFETGSIGEVERLLSLNIPSNRIIYSNPAINRENIDNLYHKGVKSFVFENIKTLKNLILLAPDAKYFLRVNLHQYKQDVMDFGATYEYIEKISMKEKELCKRIIGLTFYGDHKLGLEISKEIIKNYLKNIKIINLGGCFHIYEGLIDDILKGNKTSKFSYFIDEIDKLGKELNIHFMLEPGGAMLFGIGYAIATIRYINDTNSKRPYYHIDLGPTLGLRSSEWHKIAYISKNKHNKKEKEAYVVDCTCKKSHVFTLKNVPQLFEGDILIFFHMGIYSLEEINDFHLLKRPSIKYIYKY